MNAVLLITHAPLAQALRSAALHVFPDAAPALLALDVQPDDAPEHSLERARIALRHAGAAHTGVLVLTDLLGATPCNVATRLVQEAPQARRLLTGVNLPMLLRAISYRHEPLPQLAELACAGGVRGIGAVTPPVPEACSGARA